MVPVIPFSVLFMAIVEAQAPECYSLSRIYLLQARQPPTPELSIRHLYPPDMELNADIIGIGRKRGSQVPNASVHREDTPPIIPQACAPDKDGVRPDRPPDMVVAKPAGMVFPNQTDAKW